MHHIVGVGSPIGVRIRRFPDEKLVIGDRVPTAHREELQALLDQCGRLVGEERPDMERVLQSVNSVLRSVKAVGNSAGEFRSGLRLSSCSRPIEQTYVRHAFTLLVSLSWGAFSPF